MQIIRKFSLVCVLLAGLLLTSVRPAQAHANLVSATPAVNESLDRAPVLVELFFSEPIEGNFSKIEVLDSAGSRVDNDDARVDANNPLRMTVTVRSLKDGIYTISWKTLSLVDSHITAGAYPFAVGDVDAAALENAAAASQQISLSFGEVLFRWLSYISGAMLTGGVLFVLLVWRPALQEVFQGSGRPDVDPPWQRLAALGLLILLAANLLGLLFQTGQVVDQEIAAPWNPAATRLLFATRYGVLWLIRFVLALVCARFLLRPRSDRDTWLSFAALLGILLTFSLNSHAAAEPRWLLPIGADWLHLMAASFWVGGLVYFVAALRAIRPLPDSQRVSLTARLIPNFTRLALASVGLLVLTGVYSAFLRIGEWQALTGTLYGRILIVKTLLALPMIMLGAINFLNTSPNMKKAAQNPAGDAGLVERFRTLVSAEVILGAAVLLVVGIFTAVPPARAIATETTLGDRARQDDLVIDLDISPGHVGPNTFAVQLEQAGQPVEGAREVSLQFIPKTVDLPPSEVILAEQGGGRYAADGAFLSLPDNWQVQVSIRREGQFDVFANFEFPVGTSASQNFAWNRLAAGLLLVGALLYLLAVGRMPQPEGQRLYLTRLPALSLLVISVFVFLLPTGLEERYINPVPPNQSSVAAGEAIYRVQCIACHGPGGRGDGPVGLTLNPPPADLYEHTQPGVHPDGQLYEWITYGFADNQVMPRFKDILSDDDRWNVVNYIRTFSREAGEASQ